MSTAEEGGATVHPTSSSYGGGGVGGKFRKKPFRRPATPYDRPPTALRGSTENNSSWLKKLVVEPASKLLSYGAERFFAPLLRKRLPPPPPPPPPPREMKADVSDGIQVSALNSHDGHQEPVGGDCSQPINSSSSNDISELEQLLKQRTFTRSEIVHLKELLQSKAAEVSLEDVGKKNEGSALHNTRDQRIASGLLEENRNGRNRSSIIMSTPIDNSNVVENVNVSPAELAKAYMGNRPSKVSPSVLGIRSRVGKGDAGLLSSFPSTSGSPIMALTKKTHSSVAAPDNGFITPRSRGRSAIYNMARSPYCKGNGINRNGYGGPGPSVSSSFLPPEDTDEKLESRPMSLKRRSSVLNDELGSVGPIRRIRQKPNLLFSGLHNTTHGVGISSHAKQKFPLISEQSHKACKDVGENENESVPNSSYPCVPSKSCEVASKILQHLEKMSPKEKSSEPKLVAQKEKSTLTLTPSMLSGQALRSMEDVHSSKLLDVQDDHKLGERSNVSLADAFDFSMQRNEEVEENGQKEYVEPLDKWHPVSNNDSAVSVKASMPSTSASGSIVKTASHPQKKRGFRMSAQEDYSEDDTQCNGLVSISISKNKGPMESTLTDSKVTTSEEPKLRKPSMMAENQSALPQFSSTSAPKFGAAACGEVSTVVPLSTSDETKEALQPAALPLSFTASDKPKDTNNAPLFSFSSKVVEKVASVPSASIKEAVPSASIKEADPKIERASSLMSTPTGSLVKVPEPDKSSLNLFKGGDANEKSDTIPSVASNGPSLGYSAPPMSFTSSVLSNDTNQMVKDGSLFLFNSSASGSSTSTITPATSIFRLTESEHPISAGAPVLKFGASADQVASIAAGLTSSFTQAEPNPGTNNSETISSSLTNAAPITATTGLASSTTFGLGSSVGFPATQTSVFSSFGEPPIPSLFGIASKDASSTSQPVSSTPTSNFSSSSIPFSSSSGSLVSKPSIVFGLTHPVSSSDNTTNQNIAKFGTHSTEAIPVSSTSSAAANTTTTPGMFSFGLSFSSPSSIAIGSSTTTPANVFTLGVNGSSAPSSSSTTSTNSNPFASWQNPKPSPVFGSSNTFTSGFSFGASSSSSTPSTSIFNSPSSATPFSFTGASSPATPVSFGGADQMIAEDSMAEDHPVQQQQPPSIVPSIFGQQGAAAPTPPTAAFGFGQLGQPSPLVFGGQPQNPNPFQASSSLEFNAGGSFSLGSGGGDRSGRKIVKISRTKNRKK